MVEHVEDGALSDHAEDSAYGPHQTLSEYCEPLRAETLPDQSGGGNLDPLEVQWRICDVSISNVDSHEWYQRPAQDRFVDIRSQGSVVTEYVGNLIKIR